MVDAWTVVDVGEWLSAVQLQQHACVFAENEIDGAELLNLKESDLDYMNIKILKHRNTILNGVKELLK